MRHLLESTGKECGVEFVLCRWACSHLLPAWLAFEQCPPPLSNDHAILYSRGIYIIPGNLFMSQLLANTSEICSRSIRKGTKDGCIPEMGRDMLGERHTARKPKHQNYNPRQLLSIYTPIIRRYMTRFDSDTAQKLSPRHGSHNLNVSMSRSYSAWPSLIGSPRASDDIHAPILQELTLEIA